MKSLYYLLITTRPRQWIKNLSVFVAIFFSGNLFEQYKVLPVLNTFIIFTFTSASIYLLNDYKDREKDKLHPSKKSRPLASGKLKPQTALTAFWILGLTGLGLAFSLSEYFFLTVIIYFFLLTSYSLYFRNVIILDGMIVAAGFVLRVWAGALVSAVPISSWLIICTIATALLIAFGRRRCEMTILQKHAAVHRKTLSLYPEKFLDIIITAATAFTLTSYTLFTFLNPTDGIPSTITSLLPENWINAKWSMITIPIVMYGVFRYLYLIYSEDIAASPEEAVFGDAPLFTSIILWITTLFTLIYIF